MLFASGETFEGDIPIAVRAGINASNIDDNSPPESQSPYRHSGIEN